MKKLISLLSIFGITCSSTSSVLSCASSGPVSEIPVLVGYSENNNPSSSDVKYFNITNFSLSTLSYHLLNILTYSKNKYTSSEEDAKFRKLISSDVLDKSSIESLNSSQKSDLWKEFYTQYTTNNYSDTIKSFTYSLGDDYTKYNGKDDTSFEIYTTNRVKDKDDDDYVYNEVDKSDVQKVKDDNTKQIQQVWSSYDEAKQALVGTYDNGITSYSIKKVDDDSKKTNVDLSKDKTIYLSNNGKSTAQNVNYYLKSKPYDVIMDYHSASNNKDYNITFEISGMTTTFSPLIMDGDKDTDPSNIYLFPINYMFNDENNTDGSGQYKDLQIKVQKIL